MTILVHRDMAVAGDVAWDLLVRPDRWPEWGPSITAAESADTRIGPGSTGRVRTAIGAWLPFSVTEFEDGRSWAWRVSGVPATTHHVEPTADGCRVTFGVPTWAAPYSVVCRRALVRIEQLAHQHER